MGAVTGFGGLASPFGVMPAVQSSESEVDYGVIDRNEER